MAIACRICVAERGLTLRSGHIFKTQEELNDHLEAVHHTPVIREGETEEQAINRFLKKHPEVVNCPECIESGAEWTKK